VSKGLGFRTTDLDHQMGWCEFGEGDEMIAVLGHLDVVPEGEGWTFDPFGGEIRDGKIFAQLERDGGDRRAFFQQIIRVVTQLGGEMEDVL